LRLQKIIDEFTIKSLTSIGFTIATKCNRCKKFHAESGSEWQFTGVGMREFKKLFTERQ
jgi:hypothetical protein